MRGDLLYRSFHTRKKFLYITLSVLISIVLLIMDAYDLAMLMSVQRPNPFIHQAATTIMILHILSFAMALLGFVHSLEAGFNNLAKLALAAGGLSLLALTANLTKEISLAGFLRTEYAVT